MAYVHKTNSGSAFKNQKKEADTHADLTGSCDVDGKLYWVNVWKNVDNNGDTSIKFTFKPKQENHAAKSSKPGYSSRPLSQVLDDDIPFSL